MGFFARSFCGFKFEVKFFSEHAKSKYSNPEVDNFFEIPRNYLKGYHNQLKYWQLILTKNVVTYKFL